MNQTSLVAKQVQLQFWADQVKDCRNRPSEMSVDEWCNNHAITKSNYYYRLRQVRKACLKNLGQQQKDVTDFIELHNPSPLVGISEINKSPNAVPTSSMNTVAVLHGRNGIAVDLSPEIPDSFLAAIVKVLNHAE